MPSSEFPAGACPELALEFEPKRTLRSKDRLQTSDECPLSPSRPQTSHRPQTSLLKVTPRELTARARLQIALEVNGSFLIRKLDDDVKPPWAMARGVRTATCVVVLESTLRARSGSMTWSGSSFRVSSRSSFEDGRRPASASLCDATARHPPPAFMSGGWWTRPGSNR